MRGCIKQAQVHALPGERVHRVRGVADATRLAARSTAARAALAAGSRRASSKPRASPRRRALAALSSARNSASLAASSRSASRSRQRPDDRAAAVGERQQRERTAGHEPLPRRLAVRARARHVRDDGRLLVAVRRDRQVEQAPHRGLAAVGREQHRAAHAAAVAAARTTTSRSARSRPTRARRR